MNFAATPQDLPPARNPQPRQFGPFVIRKQLGQGGFGQVFLAQSGPKQLALKVLSDLDIEALERFQREAEVLAATEALDYFARVHSFGFQPAPYIAMEFIEAEDLKTWRNNTETTREQQLKLFAKIVEGVWQFHSLGLVHRDLKPQNIMIRELENGDLEPVIIDFGLVTGQGLETLTQSGAFMGTPLTMAPEQWQGGDEAKDQSVDIWALGVIYYFLISGEFPFEGSPMQIYQQISKTKKTEIYKKFEFNSADEKLLKSCLETDPEKRLKSCHDIEQVLISGQAKSTKKSGFTTIAIVITIVALALSFYILSVQQKSARETATTQLNTLVEGLDQKEQSIVLSYCATQVNLNLAPVSVDQIAQVKQAVKQAIERLKSRPDISKQRKAAIAAQIARISICLGETNKITKRLERSWKPILNLQQLCPDSKEIPYRQELKGLFHLQQKSYQDSLDAVSKLKRSAFVDTLRIASLSAMLDRDLLKSQALSNSQSFNLLHNWPEGQQALAKVIDKHCQFYKRNKDLDNDPIGEVLFAHGFGIERPWIPMPQEYLDKHLKHWKSNVKQTWRDVDDKIDLSADLYLYFQSMNILQNDGKIGETGLAPKHWLLLILDRKKHKRLENSPYLGRGLVAAFKVGYFDPVCAIYHRKLLRKNLISKSPELFIEKYSLNSADYLDMVKYIYVVSTLPAAPSIETEVQMNAVKELINLDPNKLTKRFQEMLPFAILVKSLPLLSNKKLPKVRQRTLSLLSKRFGAELNKETDLPILIAKACPETKELDFAKLIWLNARAEIAANHQRSIAAKYYEEAIQHLKDIMQRWPRNRFMQQTSTQVAKYFNSDKKRRLDTLVHRHRIIFLDTASKDEIIAIIHHIKNNLKGLELSGDQRLQITKIAELVFDKPYVDEVLQATKNSALHKLAKTKIQSLQMSQQTSPNTTRGKH